jgi:bacillithiol disulfide reductase
MRESPESPEPAERADAVVIGAGPVGLACAIELRAVGLSVVVVEKGALVNSFLGYPTSMELFSTPDRLEIGGHPLSTSRYKPLREEAIDYYRRVAAAEALDIRLYTRVLDVGGEKGAFVVRVRAQRGEASDGKPPTIGDADERVECIECSTVIVSTGFFDIPNLMGVPGEDLPKVTHYYKEPYAYSRQRVLVVGAKNSAAKAALQCMRNGAEVTMVVRRSEVSDRVKYWLRPDLVNRIADGSIKAFFDSEVEEIGTDHVMLKTPKGPVRLPNDFVLAMTGYQPDYPFLSELGIQIQNDAARTPVFDPKTFETNRPGVYMAGTICGGLRTGRWFIENGRFHAASIAAHLASG